MDTFRNVRWFNWYAILADFRKPQSIVAILAWIFSVYGTIWTIVESSGTHGSIQTVVIIGTISCAFAGSLILLLLSLRWPLLCRAVREYISINMLGNFDFNDCILVSCGPGGAFGVGIVSKALQSMNRKVPKSIVIDCEYTKPGEPTVASIISTSLDLSKENCLIIHTYLGTGGSLRALRKALNIPNAPVFCFVMSESLAKRNPAKYCLFVGSRSVLPWPQSETQK
ncbi:hypothetical protein [Candidatus Electronema sp. PJ]|uniref:hypothetical protein n=1 Tax=Candidatus Electronema sp. PJ TaxID=3401572 RepID=UPI003AA9536B